MTELLALSAVLLAVALPLYYITLTATKKPAPGQASREELVAEIERLNEALADVSLDLARVTQELQETRKILRCVQYYRDRLIDVMQTTLGFVQLHTDRGLNWDAPYEEKLPEWFSDYDNGKIEGWEQVRKDLEEVLPRD
mgnify:CR=1 FL=1